MHANAATRHSLEELALQKLRSARDQMSALLRSVHHLLDTLERFYPGSLGVELPEPAAACKTPGDAAAMEDQTFALAQMEMLYETLEQAMVPIDEKIAILQKNWAPRDYKFWQQVMTCIMDTHLVLAQATIPPVGGYRESLGEIGDCTDEAGILLTVLLMTHDTTASALEERIRQRQRVMKALEKLSETVHQARATRQDAVHGSQEGEKHA